MLRQLVCVFLSLHCAFAASFCNAGYTLFKDRCYGFDKNALATYDEALSSCGIANGNLVSIHDDDVNNFLQSLDTDGVLIGLQYDSNTKVYTWSDGSPFDYDRTDLNFAAWSSYFGDCAVNEKGIWKNAECSDKHKFVCVTNASISTDPRKCPDPSAAYALPTTITSPGYPEKYDLHEDRINCIYKIAAAAGQYVKINVDNITLDQNEGYIAVYKNYADDFSYFQLDNDFNGLNVIVENNLVILQLVGSLAGKYQLTLTAVSPEPTPTPNNVCPDKYRVYPVPYTLYSPGYPEYFDLPIEKLQCMYLAAGKIGYKIRVYLADVDDHADYGCMDAYSSFQDAFNAPESPICFDKRASGDIYNFTSVRFGMVMKKRYPGRFAIEFSAYV